MTFIYIRIAKHLVFAFGLLMLVIGCSQPADDSNEIQENSNPILATEEAEDIEKQTSFSNANIKASPFSSTSEKWVERRLLVKPKEGVDGQQVGGILSSHGGKVVGKISALNIYIIELPENANEKAIAALLAHNPKFEFAEVDGIRTASQITNDTYFSKSYHLPIIKAPQAWDSAKGDGVTIAILDSGVLGTHPDLIDKMVPGYNFVDNNTDTNDTYGHGTPVAGSAAATCNNGKGVAGVAWNSKIMPLRTINLQGYSTDVIFANAIVWAADHGARVASISYEDLTTSSTVTNAGNYMQNKGGVTVIALGNTGLKSYPYNTQSIIFVTATNSADVSTSWTSFGVSADLAAPGDGIYSTSWSGGYGTYGGTSFSAPIVAGVVALMMSANPALPGQQIQSLLYQNADDLGATGWDQYYGHGRVNAERAVLAAKNAVVQDLVLPTVAITSPTSGQKVIGNININVSANDNVSVTKVEVYAAGSLVAILPTAPYSCNLNTLNYADGSLSLMAKAFDGAGNIGTKTISVTVANTVDIIAPVVTISKPTSGSTVSGNISIAASATDNKGVVSMKVIIDGVTKATSTTGSISCNWNTRKVKSGVHTIQINAVDASGNVGSKIIQVTK